MMNPVKLWDRANQAITQEAIYGEEWLRRAYENAAGRVLTQLFLTKRPLSVVYGAYQDSPLSARTIPDFIRKYSIPMEEYEDCSYRTFNEFFIRKFKPGMRAFTAVPEEMPAFAEGRYSAFDRLDASAQFAVKGMKLNAAQLLERPEWAKVFEGGPAFIARLCPVDYHRYHYPDAGNTEADYRIAGPLHSVGTIALQQRPDVLITNERRVQILNTRNFGRLAYVEVGAMCVGKIVQTHPVDKAFERGQEKGYFLFGGSTVVLLGEPGKWRPDEDLVSKTREGYETLVRLGQKVAKKA